MRILLNPETYITKGHKNLLEYLFVHQFSKHVSISYVALTNLSTFFISYFWNFVIDHFVVGKTKKRSCFVFQLHTISEYFFKSGVTKFVNMTFKGIY